MVEKVVPVVEQHEEAQVGASEVITSPPLSISSDGTVGDDGDDQTLTISQSGVEDNAQTKSLTEGQTLTHSRIAEVSKEEYDKFDASSEIKSEVSERKSEVSSRSVLVPTNEAQDKIIDDDVALFEAWFEVLTKNEKGDKVNVEELVDKVVSSGILVFGSSASQLVRAMEGKVVKEELLDLIEDDLGLNVLDFISINKFFAVIIRSPRYLHRVKRASGDDNPPPKVFPKPAPKICLPPDLESFDDYPDPFDEEPENKALDKHIRRLTWKQSFKNLFQQSNKKAKSPEKKNPRRLMSRQSSSFYEKCQSFRRAFAGKSSAVRVFSKKDDDEEDTEEV